MLAFHPALNLGAYHFAHGTFQPAAAGSTHGCADLDRLLGRAWPEHDISAAMSTAGRSLARGETFPRLAEAIDVCFDAQFSCSHAEPFVGTATILGGSEGDPQYGEQASIQIEGSDTWLPALVPVHAPRGSRTSTTRKVPVVGCLVHNSSRFVLSWADMRCRSMTDASFPAVCDGASQRNVAIEDTAAAISFVESLSPQETRRKLDLGDTDNTRVKGKKTAIMVLISPSDATSALDAWNYSSVITNYYGGSPRLFVNDVVCGSPPNCHPSPPTRTRFVARAHR